MVQLSQQLESVIAEVQRLSTNVTVRIAEGERMKAEILRLSTSEANLIAQVTRLRLAPPPASPPAPPPVKEPKVVIPTPFKGKKDTSAEFLFKLQNVFDLQPQTFHTDAIKLAYVHNLLEDDAFKWIHAIILKPVELRPAWFYNWELFKDQFKLRFDHTNDIETSRHKLGKLHQTSSVNSYSAEFLLLSSVLKGYSDETLRHMFWDHLKPDIKDKILSPDDTDTLEAMIKLATTWDDKISHGAKDVQSSYYRRQVSAPPI